MVMHPHLDIEYFTVYYLRTNKIISDYKMKWYFS